MTFTTRLAPSMMLLAATLFTQHALGQAAEESMSTEEAEYVARAQALWESLSPQKGEIVLPGGFATIDVPDRYFYLNPTDTATVLEDVWGNPPGGTTLGMLMPQQYTAFDNNSWAVTIEYVEDGYVSDEDAHEIDYSDLLEKMQKETRQSSKARAEAGYGTVELVHHTGAAFGPSWPFDTGTGSPVLGVTAARVWHPSSETLYFSTRSGSVFAVDQDGAHAPGYPVTIAAGDTINSEPIVSRVSNPNLGLPELLVGTTEGWLYEWRGGGASVWCWHGHGTGVLGPPFGTCRHWQSTCGHLWSGVCNFCANEP